ncbi:MAG: helix-turn-helix transcriptional regulator [Pseudomonadota bacterium]|nr:helix-turn-helix transcriptional regulator [Pseudomonadota bacterium]
MKKHTVKITTKNQSSFVTTHNVAPTECTSGSKDCPVFTTLSLIANKWSISILSQLLRADNRTLRFNALKKALGTITQRELTKHLRQFEEFGIVDRTVYPESPPRVEYTLTLLGGSLCEPIQALSLWAEKYGERVQQKRHDFLKKKLAA